MIICAQVLDRNSNDCLKSVPLSQVTFIAVDPVDPCVFSFFSSDLVSRLITCHALRLANDKQTDMILVAVKEAFKISNGEVQIKDGNIKRHLSMSTKTQRGLRRQNSAVNAGREMGRFETAWLGQKCLHKPLNQVMSRPCLVCT